MASEKPRNRVHVQHRGEVTVIRIRPRRNAWTMLAVGILASWFIAWGVALWDGASPTGPSVRGLGDPSDRTLLIVGWSVGGLVILWGLAVLMLSTERIAIGPDVLTVRAVPWYPVTVLPVSQIRNVRLHPSHLSDHWRWYTGQIACECEDRTVYLARGADAGEAWALLQVIADRLGEDVLLPVAEATTPHLRGPAPPELPPSGVQPAQGRVKLHDHSDELVIRLPVRRGLGWYALGFVWFMAAAWFLVGAGAAVWGAFCQGATAVLFVACIAVPMAAAFVATLVAHLFDCETIRVTSAQIALRRPKSLTGAQGPWRTTGITHEYAAAGIRHLRLMPLAPFGWAGPEEDGWIAFEYQGETERFCYHVEESEARFVFDTIAARFGDTYHFAPDDPA